MYVVVVGDPGDCGRDDRGPRGERITMSSVPVTPKQVAIVVEIDGRRYDVVPDKQGGATPKPAITMTVDEILAAHGVRALTAEEFEELFCDLPSDDEG